MSKRTIQTTKSSKKQSYKRALSEFNKHFVKDMFILHQIIIDNTSLYFTFQF